MNNKMFIVGAGGFARELYDYLSSSQYKYDAYQLMGFLDDDLSQLGKFELEHSIVGSLKDISIPKDSVLIMGIASPALKESVYEFYSDLGIKFINYIHPSATVGTFVFLGEGSIVCPNVTITTNVQVGLCTTINAHSSIGHDAIIGDFSTLSGHCDITGGVSVGERVMFGSHALVIPGKVVESDSIVGAGSVVVKKVKAGTTVFGNPAKKIM